MEHLLRCPLLEHEYKAEDLAECNECARNYVQLWLKHSIWHMHGHDKKKKCIINKKLGFQPFFHP